MEMIDLPEGYSKKPSVKCRGDAYAELAMMLCEIRQ